MGLIYKIINNKNQKIYIGKTSISLQVRWKQHIYNSFNHKKPKDEYDYALHRAIRKYGEDNFKIELVEICEDEILNEREKYWISFFDSYNNGYNETLGGDGNCRYDYDEIVDFYLKNNNSLSKTVEHFHIYDQIVYSALRSKNINYKELKKDSFNKRKYNKKIKCVEENIVFDKITDIDVWLNKKSAHGNVRRCLNGTTEKAYGYHWEEIDE